MRSRRAVALILLLAFSAAFLIAQTSSSGSICGKVTDSSSAAMAGAQVSVVAVATGQRIVVGVGASGDYCVLQLAPGTYDVAVEAQGFVAQHSSVEVAVGLITPVQSEMSVAVRKESVEVTSEPPAVNTQQPDFSDNVDQAAIDNLPTNGRRWSNLALLTPGTSLDGDFGLVAFRGISATLNNNTVDGSDNNQAFFGEERGRTRMSYVVSQSAVREFQVNASNFSAEYGRAAGAVINSVTKSGTNRVHGEGFYYLRDNGLGTYNPFAALITADAYGNYYQQRVKPTDRRQQFGFSIGGPVRSDRLFYFFTWDQQVRDYPVVASALLPKLFDDPSSTELKTIKNLLPFGMRNDTEAHAAFAQGLAYLHSFTGIAPRSAGQLLLFPKIDWIINRSHTVTASYNRVRWDAPGGVESQPVVNKGIYSYGTDRVSVDNAMLRLSSILSASTANELRLLYSRDNESEIAHAAGMGEPATGPFGNAPQISVASSSYGIAFGMPGTLSRRKYPDERRVQLADTFSWMRGNNLWKAGADITRVNDAIDHLYQGGGVYSYSNRVNFIADYLQYIHAADAGWTKTNRGYNYFTQTFGRSAWDFHTWDAAYFLQDDWHALSRLTVSAGIRYERQYIPAAQAANPAVPDTSNVPSDRNNFGPRLGFAWDVFGNGNTAVRGGYGLYYGRLTNSIISTALYSTGVAEAQRTYLWRGATATTPGGPIYPYTFLPSAADPILNAASTVKPDVAFFAPHMQNAQIHQVDLIFERQLTPQTSLSFSYLLSLGRELPNYTDTNLDPASVVAAIDPANPGHPNPANDGYKFSGGPFDGQTLYVPYFTKRLSANFGELTRITSSVNSRYDGIVLQLKRRFFRGLSYNFSYTWSRSVDTGQNSSNFFSGNNTMYPGPFTYFFGKPITLDRPDYGISNYESRQKLAGRLFLLPRVRSESKKLRAIFEGWGFSPVAHISSGRPYTEYIGGTPAAIPTSCDGCTGLFGTGGTQRLPFLPRNSHRFPSRYNVDMRVARRFYVREGRYLEFLAEGFNVLNHTNVTDVSDSMYYFTGSAATLLSEDSFGDATAAGNTVFRERQIQLGLKMHF